MNNAMISIRAAIGVAAGASLIVGFGLGWWLRGGDDQSAPATAVQRSRPIPDDPKEALAAIRDDLAFERDARVALARQMEQEIQRLLQAFAQPTTAGVAQDAAKPSRPRAEPLGGPLDIGTESGSESAEPWFSDAALLEHGIPAQEVRRLREHYERTDLEIRYLRDRATREGWVSSKRFGQTLREMREELHEAVGDNAYDQILYATGQKNRVRLTNAFLESVATEAGIQSGDVIMSYAGKRVFDPTTLYIRSTEGAKGARTEIEIVRDGEMIRYFVPRGPLGAQFSHERVAPEL
jgi:hypothetical protein